MSKAGLRKVTKSVRSKNGTVRRSYWVRGTDAVKRVAKAHGGKILAGVAVAAGAAALAHRHREALGTHLTKDNMHKHFSGALHAANKWRMAEGANMAKRVVQGVGTALATHYITKAAGHVGERAGKRIGGKRGAEFGRVAAEALGEHTLGKAAEHHIERAAIETGKALRRKAIIPKRRR